eukprot:TRINITY_DN401_c0_g1_i1.p1 TRINITY_DN401_c0_g1~~TRINITY_DN401_c0_g1_i1.p1  ORF type:complete len:156 (-),score=29.99 TRINITY_DN401_c0_g1_i1:44-511(-)
MSFTLRPWDQFTDISKYSVPKDVPTAQDRVVYNGNYYSANYLAIVGAIAFLGALMHFSAFFTLLFYPAIGVGIALGLLNYKPDLKPQGRMIMAVLAAGFFWVATGRVADGELFAIISWIFLGVIPALVHAVFRQRPNVADKASSVVNETKQALKK